VNSLIKKIIGWISVIISIVIVIFYLEGFIFYSFQGNLGFLFSFFIAPIGLILGYISQNENRFIKVFGWYGNIAVIIFAFLYWTIGYIIDFL
jgi:hypothetical protein